MKAYQLFVDGELLMSGITGKAIEDITGIKINNNIYFYLENPFHNNGKEYSIRKMTDEKADTSWWTEHDTKRWNEIKQAADIIRNGGHVVTKFRNGKYIHYAEAKR